MAIRTAKLLERITVDPRIMLGKPTIRGTRLTVEHLLKALAAELDFDELKADYPFLEKEDLQACLLYASSVIEGERVYSLAA